MLRASRLRTGSSWPSLPETQVAVKSLSSRGPAFTHGVLTWSASFSTQPSRVRRLTAPDRGTDQAGPLPPSDLHVGTLGESPSCEARRYRTGPVCSTPFSTRPASGRIREGFYLQSWWSVSICQVCATTGHAAALGPCSGRCQTRSASRLDHAMCPQILQSRVCWRVSLERLITGCAALRGCQLLPVVTPFPCMTLFV